jgi:hypothetical protein
VIANRPMITTADPVIGLLVRVYFDRERACWSVVERRTRIDATSIELIDVRFVVAKAGRRRYLSTRKRNIHAFVRGRLMSASNEPIDVPAEWRQVTYRPDLAGYFVHVDDNSPAETAARAILVNCRVYVPSGDEI